MNQARRLVVTGLSVSDLWVRILLVALALGGLGLSGCKKKPKHAKTPGVCKTDRDCAKGQHCYEGKCSQCSADAHCKAGEKCHQGHCLKGCQSDTECDPGTVCKDGVCQKVACSADSDCGVGRKCVEGRCEALRKGACTEDDDCADEEVCKNGRCVPAPRPRPGPKLCSLQTIYFDYNKYTLTAEARRILQHNADCLEKVPGRPVVLEGHCDPRGTEEYNLALSNQRAQAAKKYLVNLGVKSNRLRVVPKGELEAAGTDEQSWARDRKVVFVWY